MTCEEFNALRSNERFARSTTAERAAILQHYVECPRCRESIDAVLSRANVLAVLRSRQLLGSYEQLLAAKDQQDPEWREQISKLRLDRRGE